MFERSLELLQQLEPSVRKSIPALHNWEFSRRPRQLDYLLDQARTRVTEAQVRDTEALLEQAITYAECFYLIAWRVKVALTENGNRLGSFDPKGILQVRNWLIEHPERHEGSPPLPSWAFGPDGDIHLSLGAQWKGAAGIPDTSQPTYRDPGLQTNAREFRIKLEALFSRHL